MKQKPQIFSIRWCARLVGLAILVSIINCKSSQKAPDTTDAPTTNLPGNNTALDMALQGNKVVENQNGIIFAITNLKEKPIDLTDLQLLVAIEDSKDEYGNPIAEKKQGNIAITGIKKHIQGKKINMLVSTALNKMELLAGQKELINLQLGNMNQTHTATITCALQDKDNKQIQTTATAWFKTSPIKITIASDWNLVCDVQKKLAKMAVLVTVENQSKNEINLKNLYCELSLSKDNIIIYTYACLPGAELTFNENTKEILPASSSHSFIFNMPFKTSEEMAQEFYTRPAGSSFAIDIAQRVLGNKEYLGSSTKQPTKIQLTK